MFFIKSRIVLICIVPGFLFAQPGIYALNAISFSEQFKNINPGDIIEAAGFNGSYNPSKAALYAENMEVYLYSAGYLYARINKITAEISGDSSTVDLAIDGNPGKKILIGNIKLNSDSLKTRNYLTLLNIKKYDPFLQSVIESDINRLLLYAADSGFIYAEVHMDSLAVQADDGELLTNIEISVKENDLARIDTIEILGNDYTRSAIILREMPIAQGDKYSKSKIDDIAGRLLRLGIFKNVKPANLYISAKGKYILSLEVEEGNATTFDGVAGYIPQTKKVKNKIKSDGFFTGLIDINFKNLFGTARHFEVHWEKPDRDSEYFFLRYTEPWFLGYPVNLSTGLERLVRDSTYIEWKGNFKAEWRFNQNLSIFSSVEKQVVLPDSLSNRLLRLARYEQYNVEAGITYDTRDYPPNPRKGLFFENSYALGFKNNYGPAYLLQEDSIAGDEELKIYRMQFAYFYELFKNQVASFEIIGNQITSDRLQLTDYFWFGGARTLRGYRENQFQGDFASWLKLEYRFLLNRDSRLFIFNDWAAYHYKDRQVEGEDILYGYGIGLRLDTALGILGIDFGLGQDDDFSQAKIHFGIINQF